MAALVGLCLGLEVPISNLGAPIEKALLTGSFPFHHVGERSNASAARSASRSLPVTCRWTATPRTARSRWRARARSPCAASRTASG